MGGRGGLESVGIRIIAHLKYNIVSNFKWRVILKSMSIGWDTYGFVFVFSKRPMIKG